MKIDVDDDNTGWGKYLKIRVEINLTKLLAKDKSLEVNREKIWIPLKYEKLPQFCFHCGRIALTEKCNPIIENASRDQYDAWFRADVVRKGNWSSASWDRKIW